MMVWPAADELAVQFSKTQFLQPFREGMAAQASNPNEGFDVGSVQHLLVAYSLLQSQPLLVGIRLGHLPEFTILSNSSAEVRVWFEVAQRIAFAFLETIEFVRSRLPGYPSLLVPDLTSGGTRVYEDGFWDVRFPWMAELRRAGLQFKAQPEMVPRALELPDGGNDFYGALADLVNALQATSAWQRFKEADAGMSDESRLRAKELRRAYRSAVTEDRIDLIAGELGMRAASMRRAELESVRDSADGVVAEYFRAFVEVDELLDGVASFISHRVARGDIDEIHVISADWGPPRDMRAMRVRAQDDGWRIPYELVRVGSAIPALSGVLLLGSVTQDLMTNQLIADGYLMSGSDDIPCRWQG